MQAGPPAKAAKSSASGPVNASTYKVVEHLYEQMQEFFNQRLEQPGVEMGDEMMKKLAEILFHKRRIAFPSDVWQPRKRGERFKQARKAYSDFYNVPLPRVRQLHNHYLL